MGSWSGWPEMLVADGVMVSIDVPFGVTTGGGVGVLAVLLLMLLPPPHPAAAKTANDTSRSAVLPNTSGLAGKAEARFAP